MRSGAGRIVGEHIAPKPFYQRCGLHAGVGTDGWPDAPGWERSERALRASLCCAGSPGSYPDARIRHRAFAPLTVISTGIACKRG